MFQMKNLIDVCPFHRKQLLQELFEKRKYGRVQQVWSSPGHLFVTGEDNNSLFAFDVKPALVNQHVCSDETLDIRSTASPILDILFHKKFPNKAHIVYVNSCVETWVFSKETYSWVRETEFFLSATGNKATVSFVVLHDEQNTVFWSEHTASTTENIDNYHSYKICSGIFSRDTGLTPEVVDSVNTLLSCCLPSSLCIAGDCLLIWPREPCPPGVYLKWLPGTHTVEVHVHPQGKVVSEKQYGKALDFRSLLKSITATWAAATPISGWHLVPHPSNLKVLCVDSDGMVRSISGKDPVEDVVTLTDVKDWLIGSHCFVGYFGLVVAKKNIIRIYSVDSGQLLQELNLPEDSTVTGHYMASLGLPQAGVMTENAVYQLQLLPYSKWTGRVREAPSVLKKLQKSHHATQLALEEAYNYHKKRCISGELPMEILLKSEAFQSPGLLLALLHEGRSSAGQKLVNHNLMKDIQEKFQSDRIRTRLNDELSPLLNQFWMLENQKNACVKGVQDRKRGDVSNSSLHDTVFKLLQPLCPLTVAARCCQLEVLASRCPEEVLYAIMAYLQGDDDETMVDRWCSILTVEQAEQTGSQNGPNLPIFEALCRIIFKEQPEQLMHFVHAAKKVHDVTTSASAFVRKGQQVHFYRQALRCIPKPEQTVNIKDAALVTAELLLESQIPECETHSIQVLLQWHLWQEAIQHIRQLDKKELRSQLFNSLVEAAVKENVLADYCSDILELCPAELSCLDILKFLQRQHIDSSMAMREEEGDEESIFCSSETRDLPITSLRPHLIGRIKQS